MDERFCRSSLIDFGTSTTHAGHTDFVAGGTPLDGNPLLGVLLHAIGGFAAASFYIPFKRIRGWSWESYWIVAGTFSWIIAPWLFSLAVIPETLTILREAPPASIAYSVMFGILWGIGGLTFGLSMRYLGMSLGYAVALGFCAAFGTIIPPIFFGTIDEMFQTLGGKVTMIGIVVCLLGIAVCGAAGMSKEREMSDEQKKATISEFSFVKGLWIALLAGVMSACMAFAFAAQKPIAQIAVDHGTPKIWQNLVGQTVIFAGGFLTNVIWSLFLNAKNKSYHNYADVRTPLLINYILAAAAGVTWYFQFFFYGMGETQMTAGLKFSSWTLHMAFIIIFSNLWGIFFREWRGSSRRTHQLIVAGIVVLILSTIVVGVGNKLGS